MNSFILTALLLVAVAVSVNTMAIDVRDAQEEMFVQCIADGFLTPEEVAYLLDLDEVEVGELFAEFDDNGDGVLEENEFDEVAIFFQIMEQMEMEGQE